jgi:hypothetical protein
MIARTPAEGTAVTASLSGVGMEIIECMDAPLANSGTVNIPPYRRRSSRGTRFLGIVAAAHAAHAAREAQNSSARSERSAAGKSSREFGEPAPRPLITEWSREHSRDAL